MQLQIAYSREWVKYQHNGQKVSAKIATAPGCSAVERTGADMCNVHEIKD